MSNQFREEIIEKALELVRDKNEEVISALRGYSYEVTTEVVEDKLIMTVSEGTKDFIVEYNPSVRIKTNGFNNGVLDCGVTITARIASEDKEFYDKIIALLKSHDYYFTTLASDYYEVN